PGTACPAPLHGRCGSVRPVTGTPERRESGPASPPTPLYVVLNLHTASRPVPRAVNATSQAKAPPTGSEPMANRVPWPSIDRISGHATAITRPPAASTNPREQVEPTAHAVKPDM